MNNNKAKLGVILVGAAFMLAVFLFIFSASVEATSGACSSHRGVNCSAGRQPNGKVYCNDGWTDSMVEYEFMAMCENPSLDPECVREVTDYINGRDTYIKNIDREIANHLDYINKNMDMSDPVNMATANTQLNYLYELRDRQIKSYQGILYNACKDYIAKPSQDMQPNLLPEIECYNIHAYPKGENVFRLKSVDSICCSEYLVLSENNKCVSAIEACKNNYGEHTTWNGDFDDSDNILCDCEQGFVWNPDFDYCISQTNIIPEQVSIQDPKPPEEPPTKKADEKSELERCQIIYGENVVWTGEIDDRGNPKCDCAEGYIWNSEKTVCKVKSEQYICEETYSKNSSWTGQFDDNGNPICVCAANYRWDSLMDECIAQNSTTSQTPQPEKSSSKSLEVLSLIGLGGGLSWVFWKVYTKK